jgi:hypothetical protein
MLSPRSAGPHAGLGVMSAEQVLLQEFDRPQPGEFGCLPRMCGAGFIVAGFERSGHGQNSGFRLVHIAYYTRHRAQYTRA